MAKTVQKEPKPDIVDSESKEIEYTPKELEKVQDFLSFFDRPPGQLALAPEDVPPAEEPANEQETSPQAEAEAEQGIPSEKEPVVPGQEEHTPMPPKKEEPPDLEYPSDDVTEGLGDLDVDFSETPSPLPESPTVEDLSDLGDLEVSVPPVDDLKDLDDALFEEGSSMDAGLGDLDAQPTTPSTQKSDIEDIEGPDIPSLEELAPSVAFAPESKQSDSQEPEATKSDTLHPGSIHFSDKQIKTLREKLRDYPLIIRRLVINSIIEDKLSPHDVVGVVEKIGQNAPLDEIQKFLELKLGVQINIDQDQEESARVIVSRPEYTTLSLKQKRKNFRRFQLGGLAAILLLGIGLASYQYVVKPGIYRNLIEEGQQIILKNAPNLAPIADIQEAEKLFRKALSYSPKQVDAYLKYADAYRKVGLYQNSFEKLFGRVFLKALSPQGVKNISTSDQFWQKIKQPPRVSYANFDKDQLQINGLLWGLQKKGAYLITHLDKKEANAQVLLALGKFHTDPVKRFRKSPYRNNLLGIGYFRRILTFETKSPLFEKEEYKLKAWHGIGNVYYQQGDYFKSSEYFNKAVTTKPNDISGHAGILRNLLNLYKDQKDPRLVIDHHNKVRYSIGLENELPLDVLARLGAFYIDLIPKDDLRITYNIASGESMGVEHLRNRAFEVLNILHKTSEEDEYGNVKQGKYFAEGFYQRGRYYHKVMKQPRFAMKQFEYAYRYDPRHFLSLNDRAEILLEVQEYSRAVENLDLAIQQLSPENLELLGGSFEDETLLEADIGKIYFNYGRAIYLETIGKMGETNEWQRIKEAQKYKTESDSGLEPFLAALDKADIYFSRADEIGLQDEARRLELTYYRGWSSYVEGNPRKALFFWESISPKWQLRYRNLRLAKSHALYKLATINKRETQKNLEAALGYLLFLQTYYLKKIHEVKKPSTTSGAHIRLFMRMAIIENNLGAVYELLRDEGKAIQHYWKSIEYSKQISRENEVARYNLRLSFKREGLNRTESMPLIMDFIPPQLEGTL